MEKFLLVESEEDQQVAVVNLEKNRGISFSLAYLSMDYFKYMFNSYINNGGNTVEKDMSVIPTNVTVQNKKKIHTIYESLVSIGFLPRDIYKRYKQDLQQYTKEQFSMISNMISNKVIGNHAMRLQAKSIDNIGGSEEGRNTVYWEEKYQVLQELLQQGDWHVSGIDYSLEGTTCELGHPIHKVVYIEDSNTHKEMQFGVKCINDVINLSEEGQKLLNSLFDAYYREVVEYTFVLEQYANNPEGFRVMQLQAEVLELLKPYMHIDNANSYQQDSRINVRREDQSSENKVTLQWLDAMQYYLQHGVPLLPSYQSTLSMMGYEESGFKKLREVLQNILPNVNEVVKLFYSIYLGQNLPFVMLSNNTLISNFENKDKNFSSNLSIMNKVLNTTEKEHVMRVYGFISHVTDETDELVQSMYINLISSDEYTITDFVEDLSNFVGNLLGFNEGYIKVIGQDTNLNKCLKYVNTTINLNPMTIKNGLDGEEKVLNLPNLVTYIINKVTTVSTERGLLQMRDLKDYARISVAYSMYQENISDNFNVKKVVGGALDKHYFIYTNAYQDQIEEKNLGVQISVKQLIYLYEQLLKLAKDETLESKLSVNTQKALSRSEGVMDSLSGMHNLLEYWKKQDIVRDTFSLNTIPEKQLVYRFVQGYLLTLEQKTMSTVVNKVTTSEDIDLLTDRVYSKLEEYSTKHVNQDISKQLEQNKRVETKEDTSQKSKIFTYEDYLKDSRLNEENYQHLVKNFLDHQEVAGTPEQVRYAKLLTYHQGVSRGFIKPTKKEQSALKFLNTKVFNTVQKYQNPALSEKQYAYGGKDLDTILNKYIG